jgi:glutathione S-transferase
MRLGESPYLADDSDSLADLAWTCIFARLEMLGLAGSFWGSGRLPRITDCYERLRARPGFEHAGVWERSPRFRRPEQLGGSLAPAPKRR